ncbi:MAG: glycosyltransferase family 1 protein [Candidatus Shapirobacteria bacterium]
MIIGIDVSATAYGTGVGNYTLNLVKNLIKNDKTNQYKLFFSSLRLPLPPEIKILESYTNVKIYPHKLPPLALDFLWNRLHILPIELFIGKCDIFHTSDWTQPPTLKAKTITTVHDLVPFLYPQWSHPKIVDTHTRKMKQAIKYCSYFISVSQTTQKDIQKIFPQINPNKVGVIYEAAEKKYSDFLKLSKADQVQKKNKIKNLYDLDKFVLIQGTREPRKNLINFASAFEKFITQHPKSKIVLAIVGKTGWGQGVVSKSSHIKILGYIPEKDMVALHASAMLLATPSYYEGFGLPLIKSLSVGVPVLTSINTSLSEIAGNSAILIDPGSIQSIYLGLKKILTNSKLRSSLSIKAIAQSKKFSWTTAAKQTLNIYQTI